MVDLCTESHEDLKLGGGFPSYVTSPNLFLEFHVKGDGMGHLGRGTSIGKEVGSRMGCMEATNASLKWMMGKAGRWRGHPPLPWILMPVS